jgi:hypothetical protein
MQSLTRDATGELRHTIEAIGRAACWFWNVGIDFAFPPDNVTDGDDDKRTSAFQEVLTFLHVH